MADIETKTDSKIEGFNKEFEIFEGDDLNYKIGKNEYNDRMGAIPAGKKVFVQVVVNFRIEDEPIS